MTDSKQKYKYVHLMPNELDLITQKHKCQKPDKEKKTKRIYYDWRQVSPKSEQYGRLSYTSQMHEFQKQMQCEWSSYVS